MIAWMFAAALAAAPAQDAPSPSIACPAARPRAARVDPRNAMGGYRRLDQLPQAGHVLTVMKSVGGCDVTVVKVGDRTLDVPTGRAQPVRREDVTPHRR